MKKTKPKNKLADLVDCTREKSPVPPDFADYMDAITRPMIRYWLAGQAMTLFSCHIDDESLAKRCVDIADAILVEIAEREKRGR